MKCKDPMQSCGGMQKEHGYLGHFAKSENLNKGHNTDGSAKSPPPPSILEQSNPVVVRRFPPEPEPKKNDLRKGPI